MQEMYNNNLISVKELSSAQIDYQRMRVNVRDLNFETVETEKLGSRRTSLRSVRVCNDRLTIYLVRLQQLPEEIELLRNFQCGISRIFNNV